MSRLLDDPDSVRFRSLERALQSTRVGIDRMNVNSRFSQRESNSNRARSAAEVQDAAARLNRSIRSGRFQQHSRTDGTISPAGKAPVATANLICRTI